MTYDYRQGRVLRAPSVTDVIVCKMVARPLYIQGKLLLPELAKEAAKSKAAKAVRARLAEEKIKKLTFLFD